MTFEELQASMPDATFFYYNVTREEIDALTVTAWWGQNVSVLYCGTDVEIPELAAKQVTAPAPA